MFFDLSRHFLIIFDIYTIGATDVAFNMVNTFLALAEQDQEEDMMLSELKWIQFIR